MKFATTFGHPNAVALGEIGLDYTIHYLDWLQQERQFTELLQHAKCQECSGGSPPAWHVIGFIGKSGVPSWVGHCVRDRMQDTDLPSTLFFPDL